MAAGDLTTLAAVKDWLGVSATVADDAKLARLISSASTFIQSYLNRSLASASYTEQRNGPGGKRLVLTNYPVTAVASVTVDGVTIPALGAGVSAGYAFDAYGLDLAGYTFTRGVANVQVTYTAGYATTPKDLEQACVELVAVRYLRRLRPDVTSKTLAGESVSFGSTDLRDNLRDTLTQYRRVVQP